MQEWLEIGKFVASILTPIVIVILGILLLRRIEGVKALVARESDFQKKWADEFFLCCQQFMQASERHLALLTALSLSRDLDGKVGTEMRNEINWLNAKLMELELRIRRNVVFSPTHGESVKRVSKEWIELMKRMLENLKLKTGGQNFDEIIEKINEFNRSSRQAHAEMLEIRAVEHSFKR